MIFSTILIMGISFVSGSIIGLVIGNQVSRMNMNKQQSKEFEYWINSFEDEGSSDLVLKKF